MDNYFVKHVIPNLKKYNINLHEIYERLEKVESEGCSCAEEFFHPLKNREKDIKVRRAEYNIAAYIKYGARLFDEKKRVIKDYVTSSKRATQRLWGGGLNEK